MPLQRKHISKLSFTYPGISFCNLLSKHYAPRNRAALTFTRSSGSGCAAKRVLQLLCSKLTWAAFAGALGTALGQLQHLTRLDLRGALSERAVLGSGNSVLSWLHRRCKLQDLDIASFRSGDSVAPPDVSRLTALTTLTATLAVSEGYEHARIQALSPPARLCTHLAKLTRLMKLELQHPRQRDTGWWPIADSELEQLAAMLCALTGLADLSIDRPGRWQAGHLAEAAFHGELAQMLSLTRLVLNGPLVRLTASFVDALLQLSSLKSLHLEGACGDAIAAAAPSSAFSTADQQLAKLEDLYIDLQSKRRDDTSGLGAACAKLIACCPAVQTIELITAPLSDADGVTLAASFARTQCLMHLLLPCSTGSGEGVKALARRLVHLPQLRHVFIAKEFECGVAAGTHAAVPDSVWDEVVDILFDSGRFMDQIIEVVQLCNPLGKKMAQRQRRPGRRAASAGAVATP